MEVFTARQAILNKDKKVVGYELLYRDGKENCFPVGVDEHVATSRMIIRTHYNQGLDKITNGKYAFINFSEICITRELPLLLPSNKVVIEILESVTPSDEVYKKCAALFKAGYKLALDDFSYDPKWDRFLKFIKIIKFDISKTPLNILPQIISRINALKKRENRTNKQVLLAERVETEIEFNQAKKMGFTLFQGYFFCRPEIKKDKDVNLSEITTFKLYQELCRPKLDIEKIIGCFQTDEGLTYKLLTFMNSGHFSIKRPLSSIRQAIVYLGEDELRKFMTLLTTSTMAKGKPDEILRMGAIRARTCETACVKINNSLSGEAFLTGLLSMLPAILERPMEQIVSNLPLSDEIKNTLIPKVGEKESLLKILLNAVELIEKGSWHLTSLECLKLNISYDLFCKCYNESIVWVDGYEAINS